MAMTGPGLKAAILSAIAGIPEDGRSHDAVWGAVADAIVTYITANAVVSTVDSITGVTPGSGAASGFGTGTLS